VFENRMLRKTFGPKRDEVTGGWRKLHNEHHNLYSSPSMGEKRNAYRILVKARKKETIGKTRT
jgi:hypothetical protein